MNIIEKSHVLYQEADFILNDSRLWHIFRKCGIIIPAGSFDLNLLVYPDLDVYFQSSNLFPVEEIYAKVAAQVVSLPNVPSIKVHKDLHLIYPIVPKGLYFQIKYYFGNHLWQIDIWNVSKEYQSRRIKESKLFKSKITERKKKLILEFKNRLMGNLSKTPSFSSYYIYQAVLDRDMETFAEVKNYLIKNNIKIDND